MEEPVDISEALELLDLGREVEAHVIDEDAEAWVDRLIQHLADVEPAIETLIAVGEADSSRTATDCVAD
jgi:hypothetical protein